MKTLILFVFTTLSLCLLGSFSYAQKQLVFESKSITIKPKTNDPKEKIEHTFNFKNQSKSEILIEEVRPSCTCTTPGYTKEYVRSNGEGFIKLSTTAEQLKKAGKVEAVVKTIDKKGVRKFYLLELNYSK